MGAAAGALIARDADHAMLYLRVDTIVVVHPVPVLYLRVLPHVTLDPC